MKLIGKLKEQMDKAKDKEEAKQIMENAGMELTDDELNAVTGGQSIPRNEIHVNKLECPHISDKLIYEKWEADGRPDLSKTVHF